MAAIYSCETKTKEALGKEGASMYDGRNTAYFPVFF
jgi:hypothetical protein